MFKTSMTGPAPALACSHMKLGCLYPCLFMLIFIRLMLCPIWETTLCLAYSTSMVPPALSPNNATYQCIVLRSVGRSRKLTCDTHPIRPSSQRPRQTGQHTAALRGRSTTARSSANVAHARSRFGCNQQPRQWPHTSEHCHVLLVD